MRCVAVRREAKVEGPHDLEAHVALLLAGVQAASRCRITGRSAHALWKVGDRLSVDRIDPRKGYVEGNMQLISFYLNLTKGDGLAVPAWAVRRLERRLARTNEDVLSDAPAR